MRKADEVVTAPATNQNRKRFATRAALGSEPFSGEFNGALVALINSRSDETWLPEWSGILGGVQRCAVRSRGVSWASQSFGLRRQASWLKVWHGGGCLSARRNEHTSETEAGLTRNIGGQVSIHTSA